MKIFKNSLRIGIAASTVVGFVGGWALFAHSLKPVATTQESAQVQLEPVPTLAPLNFDQRARNIQVQSPSIFSQSQMFRPRLRTGGS